MSSHGDTDKNYLPHIVVMLAFTIALGVFAFSLVIHHERIPDRIHEAKAAR